MSNDLPAPEMRASAWRACGPKAKSPDEKDAYLAHLRAAVPGAGGGATLMEAVPWGYGLSSTDPGFTATLWIRSGGETFNPDRELRYALAGDPAAINTERERWKAAVEEADRTFAADPGEKRTWSAVIGPAPEYGSGAPRGQIWPIRLDTPLVVASMTVESVDQWITQQYPRPSDRSSYYPVGFWPLSVTGTCWAHSTPGAQDIAASDLDRLCRLLTLATGIWWTHWIWPTVDRPQNPGERVVDPVADWIAEMRYHALPGVPIPEPVPLDVPQWVTDAWSRLESSASSGALEAYGSAVADIVEGRPSAAGAQLMAVLERLTRMGRDTNEARKEAITMVARYLYGPTPTAEDDKRAKYLVMYEERSRTVHGGSRHGSEPRLNMPMRVVSIDRDPKDTYEKKVALLLNVCRALLITNLGGIAPSPKSVKRDIAHFEEGVLWL